MAHTEPHGPYVFHHGGPANHILTAESRSVPFHVPVICSSSFHTKLNFSTVPVAAHRVITSLVTKTSKVRVSLAARGGREVSAGKIWVHFTWRLRSK